MEYTSKNDFYLKFKTIYDKEGNFFDYELVYTSDNFYSATKISPAFISGKNFSEITVDNLDILGFKKLYFTLLPNSKIKHELYLKEMERWYLVNAYTDKINDEEYLILYYMDVSEIRRGRRHPFIYSNGHEGYVNLQEGEKLYYKDLTTGLYNKNFFEEEIARLDTKRQLPISIIMGDINGLKLINDAFGHKMGDKVLKRTAEILSSSFREEDILCRVGGDEFMTLLPKTSKETASKIIDRIQRKCENNPLDFLKISISLGTATKETEDEDIEKTLKKAEDRMYFNKLKESKEAKYAMVKFLKARLEKITHETKSHYGRLKELCLSMAEALKLSEKEKDELILLCEFHDIGKIGVSKNILQKEGSLNSEEWEDVKRHSEIGYYIAKEFKDASPVDELILLHHERWDGKGYPGLLQQEEIPIAARIFAIADAYDVMVNDRPYKTRMSKTQALKEIKDKSGSQFDPHIANIFINIMDCEEKIV